MRDDLISLRFKEQYNHLGLEERILFGDRDFTREMDNVKDFNNAFNEQIVPEVFISVSQQI